MAMRTTGQVLAFGESARRAVTLMPIRNRAAAVHDRVPPSHTWPMELPLRLRTVKPGGYIAAWIVGNLLQRRSVREARR